MALAPGSDHFFGGGTPSLFAPQTIRRIITTIRQKFPVDSNAEVSLEANPGTVSFESIAGYRDAGINRISFGAQSFHPATLRTLGRIHSPEQTEAAVAAAREAGITNINLDLIYGVPGQSLEEVRQDLSMALALSPLHISAYSLTIEKGTPFYSAWKRGALRASPEGEVAEMMDVLTAVLPEYGLKRYEISNYSWPGFEARHNLAYWNGDDYIGIGAGAHSFCRSGGSGVRWSNYALPKKYSETACGQGSAESWRESLTAESAIFECFFLGLRKISGVSFEQFETRFGISIEELYPGLVDSLVEQELAESSDDTLALTNRGLMLTDSVLEYFSAPDTAALGRISQRRLKEAV